MHKSLIISTSDKGAHFTLTDSSPNSDNRARRNHSVSLAHPHPHPSPHIAVRQSILLYYSMFSVKDPLETHGSLTSTRFFELVFQFHFSISMVQMRSYASASIVFLLKGLIRSTFRKRSILFFSYHVYLKQTTGIKVTCIDHLISILAHGM